MNSRRTFAVTTAVIILTLSVIITLALLGKSPKQDEISPESKLSLLLTENNRANDYVVGGDWSSIYTMHRDPRQRSVLGQAAESLYFLSSVREAIGPAQIETVRTISYEIINESTAVTVNHVVYRLGIGPGADTVLSVSSYNDWGFANGRWFLVEWSRVPRETNAEFEQWLKEAEGDSPFWRERNRIIDSVQQAWKAGH